MPCAEVVRTFRPYCTAVDATWSINDEDKKEGPAVVRLLRIAASKHVTGERAQPIQSINHMGATPPFGASILTSGSVTAHLGHGKAAKPGPDRGWRWSACMFCN